MAGEEVVRIVALLICSTSSFSRHREGKNEGVHSVYPDQTSPISSQTYREKDLGGRQVKVPRALTLAQAKKKTATGTLEDVVKMRRDEGECRVRVPVGGSATKRGAS